MNDRVQPKWLPSKDALNEAVKGYDWAMSFLDDDPRLGWQDVKRGALQAALVAAHQQQREELEALLTPEALARLDEAEAEYERRYLFGEGCSDDA